MKRFGHHFCPKCGSSDVDYTNLRFTDWEIDSGRPIEIIAKGHCHACGFDFEPRYLATLLIAGIYTDNKQSKMKYPYSDPEDHGGWW